MVFSWRFVAFLWRFRGVVGGFELFLCVFGQKWGFCRRPPSRSSKYKFCGKESLEEAFSGRPPSAQALQWRAPSFFQLRLCSFTKLWCFLRCFSLFFEVFLCLFCDVFVTFSCVLEPFFWCFCGVFVAFRGVFVAFSWRCRGFSRCFSVFLVKSGAFVEGLLQGAHRTSFVAKSCWKRPFLEGLLQLKLFLVFLWCFRGVS